MFSTCQCGYRSFVVRPHHSPASLFVLLLRPLRSPETKRACRDSANLSQSILYRVSGAKRHTATITHFRRVVPRALESGYWRRARVEAPSFSFSQRPVVVIARPFPCALGFHDQPLRRPPYQSRIKWTYKRTKVNS